MRENSATPEFNLESYLEHSKKVDVIDMDFTEASLYPLSEEEIRCLTYMMDIETHTIVYLKGILSTCAIRDPRTTSFLSCWAYEEFFYGHTLRRFLEAAGVSFRRRAWPKYRKKRHGATGSKAWDRR